MRKSVLASVVVLAMTPGLAGATVEKEDFDINTTAQLLDLCSVNSKSPMAVQAASFCLGFIEGAAHYHDHVSTDKSMGRLICPPPGATRADARVIFVNWAQDNGSDKDVMESNALVGLMSAAMDTWPCRPK